MNSMKTSGAELESLSPNLVVKDVNRSVQFYSGKLGFNLIVSVPEQGVFNWAMVQRGPVTIMFQTLPSIQEDLPELKIQVKGSLGTFYIKVKGLDQLYQTLKGNVEIIVEMRKTFYGAREFAVKDPDDYILMFAEDAP